MNRVVRCVYWVPVAAGKLLRHPHHYLTSLGLTILLVSVGEVKVVELMIVWGYAFFENISEDLESYFRQRGKSNANE